MCFVMLSCLAEQRINERTLVSQKGGLLVSHFSDSRPGRKYSPLANRVKPSILARLSCQSVRFSLFGYTCCLQAANYIEVQTNIFKVAPVDIQSSDNNAFAFTILRSKHMRDNILTRNNKYPFPVLLCLILTSSQAFAYALVMYKTYEGVQTRPKDIIKTTPYDRKEMMRSE